MKTYLIERGWASNYYDCTIKKEKEKLDPEDPIVISIHVLVFPPYNSNKKTS